MSTVSRTITIQKLKGGKLALEYDVPESLEILEDPKDQPPEFHGVFRVMTPEDGDKRVVWDARSFQQIREAKEMFDKLLAEGLVPYRVGAKGSASDEVMDEFDPHAEEVIFVPIGLAVGG